MDRKPITIIGRQFRNVGRLAHIANIFARHGLWSVVESIGVAQWLSPQQLKEVTDISHHVDAEESTASELSQDPIVHGVPARLRKAFEELGPAFVKLGQVLATREDLLPKEFILELKKLHSTVQPLDYSAVEKVLKSELSEERIKEIEYIDQKPLAAGSIAQVHRARLKSGEEIVLKIQRPNITKIFETDLSLMELLASLMERYLPESKTWRPGTIIDEFARASRGELDFIREGGTMQKIAANFAGVDYVRIADVYWNYTSSRVLAQSYLEGFSVYDKEALQASDLNVKTLVERGLAAFMQMVFVDGFYHGDLHPGNLIVLPNGSVGIIDFGVGVIIGRAARERLAGLLMALVEEDYETMVSHFVELSFPGPEFDIELFTHEVSNALAPFVGLTLSELKSGRLLWELATIAGRHSAPMPRELILFLRTLVAFEGIGTELDPEFDVLKACEKFANQLVREMYSTDNLKRQGLLIARDFAQLGRHAPRQIRTILRSIIDGDLSLKVNSPEVEQLGDVFERLSSRVALSVITAALVISSSVLIFAQAGRQVYNFSLIGIIELALALFIGSVLITGIIRSKK
jgi:ubiquinone biosynthesis protein